MDKVKIKVEIEKGAAIRAGRSEYGEVDVAVDPAPLNEAQREELVTIYGKATEAKGADGYWQSYPLASVDDLDVAALMDWRLQHRRARKAQEEAGQEALDKRCKAARAELIRRIEAGEIEISPETDCIPARIVWPSRTALGLEINDPVSPPSLLDPKTEDAELLFGLEKKRETAAKQYKKEAAAKRAEREAKEAAEQEEIGAALSACLAGADLARYQRGYLGEEEQRARLREYAWGDRDKDLAKYKRLKSSDMDHNDGCYGDSDNVEFHTRSVDALSKDEYAALVGIEQAFPGEQGWSVSPRAHVATCCECTGSLVRHSALVSKRIGPYTLSREYGLGQ